MLSFYFKQKDFGPSWKKLLESSNFSLKLLSPDIVKYTTNKSLCTQNLFLQSNNFEFKELDSQPFVLTDSLTNLKMCKQYNQTSLLQENKADLTLLNHYSKLVF